jgi:hypothetical protein
MAAVLGNTSVATIVGTSLVQYAPIAISFFVAGVFMIPSSREWLRDNLAGKRWLVPVLVTFVGFVIFAISWIYLALSAGCIILVLTIWGLSNAAYWIKSVGVPGLASRIFRHLSRRQSVGLSDRILARMLYWHFRRAPVQEPSDPRESITPLALPPRKRQHGRSGSSAFTPPPEPAVYMAIAATLLVFIMPAQLASMERVAYDNGTVVAGYVIRSDEAWTTVITKDRTIRTNETDEVRSRIPCRTINVSLIGLPSELKHVWNGIQNYIRLHGSGYYSRPDTCALT